MRMLLQARVSSAVTGKITGELTVEQFNTFIAGANLALAHADLHYNYIENSYKNNYGIAEGTVEVPFYSKDYCDYCYFLQGYTVVMEILLYFKVDTAEINREYLTLTSG